MHELNGLTKYIWCIMSTSTVQIIAHAGTRAGTKGVSKFREEIERNSHDENWGSRKNPRRAIFHEHSERALPEVSR